MRDFKDPECERLWTASVPFVLAEASAQDALEDLQARVKVARSLFKASEKAAAIARATWVDYLLLHDHQTLCLASRPAPAERGEPG